MEPWQAEALFNDLCGYYMGIRPDSVRRGYLEKMGRLDAEACGRAIDVLVTRSKRFPSLAEIVETTHQQQRSAALSPTTTTPALGAPHPDGPYLSRAELSRRLRGLFAKLERRDGRNPFLTPAEVQAIHEKWSLKWRAHRRTQQVCDCCTVDMADEREVGAEG